MGGASAQPESAPRHPRTCSSGELGCSPVFLFRAHGGYSNEAGTGALERLCCLELPFRLEQELRFPKGNLNTDP